MKKVFLSIITLSTLLYGFAQSEKYEVSIDLTASADDKLPVVIKTPEVSLDTVEYHMPKIVPGTYSISDFGRFVSEFKASDAEGNELPFEKISTNKWRIISKGQLKEISYLVDDTWESFEGYEDNVVFEPGGTNINADQQTFIINTFGFIGYIDGLKALPFELKVNHSEEIFGATALRKKALSTTQDVFYASDYNFLADGPILYSVPDTVTRVIAGAEILVSVVSPNNVLTAKEVMDNIYDLMVAQSEYLGGQLPVDRYAYLINLFDSTPLSRARGALEHSYSSVYNLPEANAERIGQIVRDVAAHEFLHIVTPLNIHSKEIGDFDYITPQMSKHLWLYEGVTEYASVHVQVKHGLFDGDRFLEEIKSKLHSADGYPNVSFTEMSSKILDPEFEPMYGNVYEKGALIGMCLDLYIMKYSNGEKSLQWLMAELSKKYGKDISFDDKELFDVITDLTSPEIREFFTTYVEGNTPLPIQEVLGWAGVDYVEEIPYKEVTLGDVGYAFTENRELMVADLSESNAFAEKIGLMEGDILMSIQGQEVKITNVRRLLVEIREATKPGEKMVFVVSREIKGKTKTKKLKAKAMEIEEVEKHNLNFSEKPSTDQEELLRKWIGDDRS
ncbi:MAG: putative metalloprotease with PDZ domain [Marinoscillum sp.]|jgi:predicted metalloprotease with PDZ domain